MTKVHKKWLSGQEAPEELEKKLIEQRSLFARLHEILVEKELSNYSSRLKKTNYEKSDWAHLQADAIGYARAIQEIKTLLTFTKED